MPKIEIYTVDRCAFCRRAKKIFDDIGVEYEEINIAWSKELKEAFKERTNGATTVPQIFIDGEHIGDFSRLGRLYESGELGRKLNLTKMLAEGFGDR